MAVLRQKVRLELESGDPIEVVFDGRDLRAWENQFRKSSLAEPMSVSMLTWLGWHAANRQGLLDGKYEKYDDFDNACVGVQGIREDPTKRPTKKGR